MKIVNFNKLPKEKINIIANIHYNHWVKFNPKMDLASTIDKFNNKYSNDKLPFGIALIDKDNIVGFCVLREIDLEKYIDIKPWISDVMILSEYRNKGYGKYMIECAKNLYKSMGYSRIYLWTDQAPEFYKKIGFTFKQKIEKNEGGSGELYYIDVI